MSLTRTNHSAAALVLFSTVLCFAQGPTAASSAPSPAVAVAPLHEPYGVAVDKSGKVYVTNLITNTITVYNKALKLVGTISAGMNVPEAIGIGTNGNIDVGNTAGNNITVYGPDLVQFTTITDNLLQYPTQIFVDRNNDILLLDSIGVVHLYLDIGAPINYLYLPGTTAIVPWDSANFGDTWTAWGPGWQWTFSGKFSKLGGSIALGPEQPRCSRECAISNRCGAGWPRESVPRRRNPDCGVVRGCGLFHCASDICDGRAVYGITVDATNKRLYLSEPTLNQVAVWSTSPIKLIGNIK